MSQITQNPVSYIIEGNIVPSAIAALANTTPFSGSHATLSILTAVTIDGHSLKRLKVVPSW